MEQTSKDEESGRAKMYVPKKSFLSRMQSRTESESGSSTSFSPSASTLDLLAAGMTARKPHRDDSISQISLPDELRISFSEIDDGSLPLDDIDFNCSPSPDVDLTSGNLMNLDQNKEVNDDKDLEKITSAISSTSENRDSGMFSHRGFSNSTFGNESTKERHESSGYQSSESSERLSYEQLDNGGKNTKVTNCERVRTSTSSDDGLDRAGQKRSWNGTMHPVWANLTKSEAPQVSTVGSSGEVFSKKKLVSPRRSSKNKHMENKLCQVCGDVAAGFYCGAYICEACKKFYMRAYKQDKLKYVCLRDKNCVITKESRVQCQYCRFQKCVDLNMYCPKQGEDHANKDMNMADIPCRVCAAPSSGFHFGAITCEGCKGFFRRMAKEREPEKYQCNKSGKCEINMITRNLCKACRYKQCLTAGMSVEGSRIGRQPNSVKHAISLELKNHVKPDVDKPGPDLDLGEPPVQIKQEPLDMSEPDTEMKSDDLYFWDEFVSSDYPPQSDRDKASKSSTTVPSISYNTGEPVSSNSDSFDFNQSDSYLPKYAQSQKKASPSPTHRQPQTSKSESQVSPVLPLPLPAEPQFQIQPHNKPQPQETRPQTQTQTLSSPTLQSQSFKNSTSTGPQTSLFRPSPFISTYQPSTSGQSSSASTSASTSGVRLEEGRGGEGGKELSTALSTNEEMDDFLAKIVEAGKVLQLLNYRVFDTDINPTTSMNVEEIKSLFKSKYMDPRMGNHITSNVDMSIFASKESTWNYMMTNFHHNTYITIRFAKMVPGFKSLLLHDQVKLIQYSIYPIELLNMSKVFDPATKQYNYFTYTKEEENIMMEQFPMLNVLKDHLIHIGEMVTSFEFTDEEFALLSALLLFPAEIHGLENPKAVDELQNKISLALQYYEEKTFPDGPTRYGVLLVRVAELVQCLLQHNLAIGLLLTHNPSIQVPQLFHELIIESIKEGQK